MFTRWFMFLSIALAMMIVSGASFAECKDGTCQLGKRQAATGYDYYNYGSTGSCPNCGGNHNHFDSDYDQGYRYEPEYRWTREWDGYQWVWYRVRVRRGNCDSGSCSPYYRPSYNDNFYYDRPYYRGGW